MILKKYDILLSKNSAVVGFSLIFCAMLSLTGCWGSSKKDEAPQLVVINVLDPSYYQDCHIRGSINVPFEQFEEKIKTLSKNNSYVVYCSNYACTAAPYAVKMMLDAGFASAALFPGGIVDWYQQKLPYDGPAQLQYLQEENEAMDDDHDGLPVISAQELCERMGLAK